MPKVKCAQGAKLRKFVQEFGANIFSTDDTILFCKLCEIKVSAEKRFNVQQHCASAKHQKGLTKLSSSENRQRLLLEKAASTAQSSDDKVAAFSKDLCQMMVTSNIPFKKLSSSSFRSFLEKYISLPIPEESTLRKNYLSDCYEDVLKRIRSTVGNNKIWVSIDETTDVEGRFIANVIVGILRDETPSEKFLLTCEVLQKVNNSTIAMLFDDAMKLLWPAGVERDNVLLFVTDAAPYMIKAAKGLKLLYPKMIHVTCLAHGLHRLAEEIRKNYPDIDKLISNGKKMFLKAPIRIQKFKEAAPTLSLPPQPILTRWGTWLDAALYYCANYDCLKDIVQSFDSSDASSIEIVKDCLASESLPANLAYIKSNFAKVSTAITQLETVGLKLTHALEIVQQVSTDINQSMGGIAEKIKEKLVKILQCNPGYSTLCKISDILCGNKLQFNDLEPELSPEEITFFKFAPITSCDVERSFSIYKSILSDQRRSFQFQHLKMHVVIQCNCSAIGQ